MSDRFDAAVWSGVERRLAGVETFIPDAPPWHPSTAAELTGKVRLGSAFGRPSATVNLRRGRLVLGLTVIAVALAIVAVVLLAGGRQSDADLRDGPFGPYGMFRPSDRSTSAAVLPGGRALIVSGAWAQMGEVAVARADLWDPVQGREPTGAPTIGRVAPTATLLLDGRVLVVGGFGGPFAYASSAIASAEIWDPKTESFRQTGSMASPRVGHTATMLADGRVLVTGGTGPDGAQATAEVWDPETEQFSPAGKMVGARIGGLATLLPDGQVLIWGGGGPSQVWRPEFGNFVSGGLLDRPGFATATRLLDGRLLLIQGRESGATITLPPALLDADGPSTAHPGSLNVARTRFAATLLADGRVLITGGVSPTGEALASVEIWDPVDGEFRLAPPVPRPVADHSALLLPDGGVLIVFTATGPDLLADPLVFELDGLEVVE